MKKLLILSLLFFIISCAKTVVSPPKDNQEVLTIEGTVVRLFNLLIPTAEAADTNFAILLGGQGESCSLPESVLGKDCPSDRCAFLIDTGIIQGEETVGKVRLLAIAPVVDGKFSFNLKKGNPLFQEEGSKGENPLFEGNNKSVLKVIVRGWDPKDKKPISRTDKDREFVVGVTEIQGRVGQPKYGNLKIEITPETTVSARRRVEVLKSNILEEENPESFFTLIKETFGVDSLRELALQLIAVLIGEASPEKELMESLQSSPPSLVDADLFKPVVILAGLKKDHDLNPLNSRTSAEVISELSKINSHISQGRGGQTNQLARYPARLLIQNSINLMTLVSQLETIKGELDLLIQSEGESPAVIQKRLEVKNKEEEISPIALIIEKDCKPHSLYVQVERALGGLQDLKLNIDLSDSKFISSMQEIQTLQEPILLKGLLDKRDLGITAASCPAARDFNTTRSNKDK